MEKPTKDLMNELTSLKHKGELDRWIEEHKHENKSFGQYFQELCKKYNTNPSKLSSHCAKSKRMIKFHLKKQLYVLGSRYKQH